MQTYRTKRKVAKPTADPKHKRERKRKVDSCNHQHPNVVKRRRKRQLKFRREKSKTSQHEKSDTSQHESENHRWLPKINGSLFRPWLDWSGEKSSELKFTAPSKVSRSSFNSEPTQITLARFLPTLISANQELVLCFKPYHFGKFRIKSVAHEKTEQRSWKLDVTKIDRIKHSAKLVRFVTRRQVSRIGWRWDPLHPS